MAMPAAVLSIAVQASGVAATQRHLGEIDSTGRKAGGSLAKFGKVMAVGVAGGVAAAGMAVKGFVDAAKESEVSSAKMKTQLKALGIDYGKHADQIDKVIAKHSALSGLDDEDLQDSFTNIVRVTGDVNKALELNGLAADFARAKGMDVAKAGELIGKVAGGNVGILGRYGIQVEKGASATEALALLQQKFAGQAEAYGNTAAGAQEKFGVAVENLQEVLGERLLPIITKVVGGVADFVNGMQTGEGAGGKFAEVIRGAFDRAKEGVGIAVNAIRGWLTAHKDDLDAAMQAAQNVGKAIQWAFENVALPVIQRVLPVIQQFVTSTFQQIGGIIDLIVGLLTGDFSRAWEGIQAIVKGALDKTVALLGLAWDGFKAAGGLLLTALVEGFKALPGLIVDLGKWLNERMDEGLKAVLEGIKGLGRWLLERLIDGLKLQGGLVIALGKWLNDRMDDGLRAVVEGIKNLGKWLLERWVDGLKAQGALVIALGEWIKDRIMNGLNATVEAIKGLGSWVLDKVIDGLRERAEIVAAIGGWIKNRIKESLDAQEVVDAIKALGGTILDRIIDGLKNVGTKVKDAVIAIKNAIVDAIKEVFKDALSIPLKIKLPDIDIPLIGGGYKPGSAGPSAGGGLQLPSSFASTHQTGGLPGYPAVDVFGPPGQPVLSPAAGVISKLSGSAGGPGGGGAFGYSMYLRSALGEYFMTHFGSRAVRLGQRVGRGSLLGTIADYPDRADHIHIGLRRFANGGVAPGGWALVGERGPELAHLPTGTRVYSNRESRAMVGGGPTVLHAVLDLGRGIQQRVQLEFDEHGRQQRSAYWAGA